MVTDVGERHVSDGLESFVKVLLRRRHLWRVSLEIRRLDMVAF